jgi:S-adenosylmethionine-dependent methyltransferase
MEVAIAYAHKSHRPSFPVSIRQGLDVSHAKAEEVLTRWGRGVSYHDFELALGDLTGLVVGDGFDEEILAMRAPIFEEKLLYAYVKANNLAIPPGFLKHSIDIILQKPGGERREARSRDLTELMRL